MSATMTRNAVLYPSLLYRDAEAAMAWLERTLGFERRHDHRDPDGNVAHAEMTLGGATVMLGTAGAGREPFSSRPAGGSLIYCAVERGRRHRRDSHTRARAGRRHRTRFDTARPANATTGSAIFVVSDSLTDSHTAPGTETTTIVPRADAVQAVEQLKVESGKEILMFGSRTLWNHLLAAGLVDELHLMVGASMLGGAGPAFGAGPIPRLRLVDSRRHEGSHNVLLRYEVVTSTRLGGR